MEKITKEELLEQLKLNGVNNEDLSKIAGGEEPVNDPCMDNGCMEMCLKKQSWNECLKTCSKF
ncbi:MAG: hypothetical protein Q4F31_10890 [Eubacteriales bacterium]|nr:hypothetical protein [Eubacteriales bacterium]